MGELALIALLILSFLVGLVLVPFGLPGTWVMVAALIGYAAIGGFERVGAGILVAALVLALLAELAEAWLGFRFAKRYGGSSRAGWGAVAGGLIGAVVGTPVPLIGNVIGAFVGAFLGAVALEYTARSEMGASLGAGWGAVLGRAAGAAVKIIAGLVIAILGIYAAVL